MLFYSLYDQETASQTQSPAQTVNETDENHSEKQLFRIWDSNQIPKRKTDEANHENAFDDCVLKLEEEKENFQLFRSHIHLG